MDSAVAPLSVVDLEKQYLLQNYARFPLVLHRGKGCYVYDTEGKRYLDLIAGIGVNALGYAHPRITKVIRDVAPASVRGDVRRACSRGRTRGPCRVAVPETRPAQAAPPKPRIAAPAQTR